MLFLPSLTDHLQVMMSRVHDVLGRFHTSTTFQTDMRVDEQFGFSIPRSDPFKGAEVWIKILTPIELNPLKKNNLERWLKRNKSCQR